MNIFDPKRRTAYWSAAILTQKTKFVCLFLCQLYSQPGCADFDVNRQKYSLGCLPVLFFSDFENLNLMTSWRPFCINRLGTCDEIAVYVIVCSCSSVTLYLCFVESVCCRCDATLQLNKANVNSKLTCGLLTTMTLVLFSIATGSGSRGVVCSNASYHLLHLKNLFCIKK